MTQILEQIHIKVTLIMPILFTVFLKAKLLTWSVNKSCSLLGYSEKLLSQYVKKFMPLLNTVSVHMMPYDD